MSSKIAENLFFNYTPKKLEKFYKKIIKGKGICFYLELEMSFGDTISQYSIKYQFKVCLIGDPAVGKTCLVNRYCYNKFIENTKHTIGISFNLISFKAIEGDEVFRVGASIWDFGGQNRFKKLFSHFIAGAHGILLVFDLTRIETLNDLESEWMPLLGDVLNDLPKILVGAKSDLLPISGKIPESYIEDMRKKLGCAKYIRTSSKVGENVHNVFYSIVSLILKKYYPNVMLLEQADKI